MSRILVILSALFSAIMFAAPLAHAENYWSSMGAGCVPTDGSIQNDSYFVVAGSVKHPPGSTDGILLLCPVQNNPAASNPNTLHLTYRDSSGTSTSARVKAILWRQARSNGAVTAIATASSDQWSTTGDTQNKVWFSHTLNFDVYRYFVTAEVIRNYTSQNVIFYGVSLDEDIL